MQGMDKHAFLQELAQFNPHHPLFMEAAEEILSSIWPVLEAEPQLAEGNLLRRLCEPDRVISFRVTWVDDAGQVQVNRGYRVQHSNALGPYKGGIRFHETVTQDTLRFLAFEQTFKNALTGLPMGGGKGGSDFHPRGRSEGEIMRFCQVFMAELWRHIGPHTDVPAGDIGVGGREVGYLAGMYRKLSGHSDGTLTGKGLSFGGSQLRPEATGYGLVYFTALALDQAGQELEGLRVAVSGAGNVAVYAAEKALQLGARVISLSDSQGVLKADITPEVLARWQELSRQGARLSALAPEIGGEYLSGAKPWGLPCDVALPCATQNELDRADAEALAQGGTRLVAEGANMPSTAEAIQVFRERGIIYLPGKAANAGGVAVSGLEMAQNAAFTPWTRAQVDERLHGIMSHIHREALEHAPLVAGRPDYAHGANIAAFRKVADAVQSQGII